MRKLALLGVITALAFTLAVAQANADQSVDNGYRVSDAVVYLAPLPDAELTGRYSVDVWSASGFEIIRDANHLHRFIAEQTKPATAIVIHRSQLDRLDGRWLFDQAAAGSVIAGVNLDRRALTDKLGITGKQVGGFAADGPSELEARDFAGGGDRLPAPRSDYGYYAWVDFRTFDGEGFDSAADFQLSSLACYGEGWEIDWLHPTQLKSFELLDGSCSRPISTPTPRHEYFEPVTPISTE